MLQSEYVSPPDKHRFYASGEAFLLQPRHGLALPIALTSLIDENRQWFKSAFGLNIRQTERCVAFCDHAVRQKSILVIEDALRDRRFVSNPLVVADPNIRFYAGAPLITPDNYIVGTPCVISPKPRSLEGVGLVRGRASVKAKAVG